MPVKLIGAPSNQTINETDTVTFVCNISGNPAPVIKWYKDELTFGTGVCSLIFFVDSTPLELIHKQ